MAENIEVKVKVDTGEAVSNIGKVDSAIKDFGKNTSNATKSQIDYKKELLGSNEITRNLSKATGGLSDVLLKSVKGIDLTKLSLKGLKGAIMSTGVGILVIALGELINILADFFSAEKRSEKAVESMNNALERQADLYDEVGDRSKFYNDLAIKNAKANGESATQIDKRNEDFFQSEKARIKAEISLYREKRIAIQNNSDFTDEDRKEQIKANDEYTKKLLNDETKNLRNRQTQNVDFYGQQKAEEKANNDKIAQAKKTATDKANADALKNRELVKSLEKKYKLDIENLEDDTDQKKLDRQKARAIEEVNLLVATSEQKKAILKQIDADFILRQTDLDLKLKEISDKKAEEDAKKIEDDKQKAYDDKQLLSDEKILGIENEMEADNLSYEARKQLLSDRETELLSNEKLTANERIRIQADTVQAQSDIDEEAYQGKMALLSATSSALSMASDVIGKETAVGKGMAIASALMNTYQGITAGVKLGYPLSIPAVAMASITGFAAVKNIMKVKVPAKSGGGSSVGGSAPSMKPPPVSAPNFNVVGASSTNQIAETVATQNKQPIKAFVVANDVTTQQSLDRSIVQTAGLG